MGRAVAQAAFHRDVRHFAFPFGDRASFRRQHVGMAEEAGFASAASAIPGVVQTEGRTSLHALPRVAWDGGEILLFDAIALLATAGLWVTGLRSFAQVSKRLYDLERLD